MALLWGREAMVPLLLERGAEIDVYAAAALGMANRVRQALAESPDLIESPFPADKQEGQQGVELMFWACLSESPEVVSLLAAAGADVNVEHANSMTTPLTWAVANGRAETVKVLLELGAPPDGGQLTDPSPLFWALHTRQLAVAKMLLDHGADPNYMSRWFGIEVMPLHIAVSTEAPEMVLLLLDRGARLNVVAHNGQTPLDAAEERRLPEIERILRAHWSR